MKRIGWIVTGLSVCGLQACSPDIGRRVYDDNTIVRVNHEPLSLDPQRATTEWEYILVRDMYAGLFGLTAGGDLTPDLAEDWSVSEDGLVWEFQLYETAWSDGTPLTAHDFVFAIRRAFSGYQNPLESGFPTLMNSQSVLAGELPVEALGVEAPTLHTLRLRLSEPTPYVPQILAQPSFYALPKHLVERHGDQWISPDIIETSGAFKLSQWEQGEAITLMKNESYVHNEGVCLDRVIFKFAINESVTDLVRAGRVDIVKNLGPNMLGFLNTHDGEAYLRLSDSFNMAYLALNTRRPPFSDSRVRHALAMAIDRKAFVPYQELEGDHEVYTIVPPGLENYISPDLPDWTQQSLEYRRTQARALLEEVGYGEDNPLRFTLGRANPSEGQPEKSLIVEQIESLAPWVEVDDIALPLTVFYDEVLKGSFDAQPVDWGGGTADPANFLYLVSQSGDSPSLTGWVDAEFERIADQAMNAEHDEEYLRLATEAERIALEAMPLIPLIRRGNYSFVRTEVTGWVDNIHNIHPSRYLCIED